MVLENMFFSVLFIKHTMYSIYHILFQSWENISLYALGMLHNMCGSSAYVMTSYVSVERALCLCTPLKVRTIITREVTLAVLSTTCIVVPCSYVYIMLAYDIIWVFDTRFNTSIATIKTTTMYQKDPTLRKYITAITWFWGISTTSVILVSVIIIITGLRHSNEFRSKTRISKGNVSKSQLKESKLSKRDRQLVKILLLMSAVHFLNVIPRTAGSFVGEFLPGLAYLGKLTNLVSVSYSVTLSLDLFNASVNLFFFLSTSTNFRSVFLELLKSAKIQPRAVSICWKTTPCSHL